MTIVEDRLTDEDKSRCRYHLGYLLSTTAASLIAGISQPIQTVFILEQALNNIRLSDAVRRVRDLLCKIDAIEQALFNSGIERSGVAELGDMKLHPLRNKGQLETDTLELEYRRWTDRLADVLGVPKYPYAQRNRPRGGPGSSLRISR